jgi:hypothetical protein
MKCPVSASASTETDQGHDPELYNRERQKIKPVESFIQLIAEAKQSEP